MYSGDVITLAALAGVPAGTGFVFKSAAAAAAAPAPAALPPPAPFCGVAAFATTSHATAASCWGVIGSGTRLGVVVAAFAAFAAGVVARTSASASLITLAIILANTDNGEVFFASPASPAGVENEASSFAMRAATLGATAATAGVAAAAAAAAANGVAPAGVGGNGTVHGLGAGAGGVGDVTTAAAAVVARAGDGDGITVASTDATASESRRVIATGDGVSPFRRRRLESSTDAGDAAATAAATAFVGECPFVSASARAAAPGETRLTGDGAAFGARGLGVGTGPGAASSFATVGGSGTVRGLGAGAGGVGDGDVTTAAAVAATRAIIDAFDALPPCGLLGGFLGDPRSGLPNPTLLRTLSARVSIAVASSSDAFSTAAFCAAAAAAAAAASAAASSSICASSAANSAVDGVSCD